jgi:kinesin family protein 4/21/27
MYGTNERSYEQMKNEVMKLQSVLKEREDEIGLLEMTLAQLKSPTSPLPPPTPVFDSTETPDSPSPESQSQSNLPQILENGRSSTPPPSRPSDHDLNLSPRTRATFDAIKANLNSTPNGLGFTNFSATETETSETTNAHRLDDLMRSMAKKESSHREAIEGLEDRLGTLQRQHDELTVLSRDQVVNMSTEIEKLRTDLERRPEASHYDGQLKALETDLAAKQVELDKSRREAQETLESTKNELIAGSFCCFSSLSSQFVRSNRNFAPSLSEHQRLFESTLAEHANILSQLKEEHAVAFSQLTAERDDLLLKKHKEHEEAIRTLSTQHEESLATSKDQHSRSIEDRANEHSLALSHLQSEHDKSMQAIGSEIEQALASRLSVLTDAHSSSLELVKAEHARLLEDKEEAHRNELAQLKETFAAESASQKASEVEEAHSALASHHQVALEEVRAGHQRSMETLQNDHAERVKGITAERDALQRSLEDHQEKLRSEKRAIESSAFEDAKQVSFHLYFHLYLRVLTHHCLFFSNENRLSVNFEHP